MTVTLLGMIILVNFEQSKKANLPIELILFGIVILVRFEQLAKANSPIVLKLEFSANVTLVTLVL
jgi:hypothetical protein